MTGLAPAGSLAAFATVTLTCESCGRRVRRPGVVLLSAGASGLKYCGEAGCTRRRCVGCGMMVGPRRPDGLDLCGRCSKLVWSACGRKLWYGSRTEATAAIAEHEAAQREGLHVQECALCLGFHLTRVESVEELPADYRAVLGRLVAAVAEHGPVAHPRRPADAP